MRSVAGGLLVHARLQRDEVPVVLILDLLSGPCALFVQMRKHYVQSGYDYRRYNRGQAAYRNGIEDNRNYESVRAEIYNNPSFLRSSAHSFARPGKNIRLVIRFPLSPDQERIAVRIIFPFQRHPFPVFKT